MSDPSNSAGRHVDVLLAARTEGDVSKKMSSSEMAKTRRGGGAHN